VVSAADGSLLWTKPIGCRIRPLIVGDTLYAEPWAFDLRTGEQRMRTHPLTGRPTVWEMERPGHHCGCISGSPNALFFRSWSSAYYDLVADDGTNHFGGQRAGCWINMIPCNGLVVEPEASSGCICQHSIHTTVVFKPQVEEKSWGLFASRGEMLPVRHIGLALGAPGDRRDPSGNLWLAHPRPWGRMRIDPGAQVGFLPKCGYFAEPAETFEVAGTDSPWLYASGAEGLSSLKVPVVGEGDGAALYTVKLGFAPRPGDKPGQRVFDIKLQGETVATGVDIAAETSGARSVVLKQFAGIKATDTLNVSLVPQTPDPAPTAAPALSTFEAICERMLSVGMTGARMEINNLNPSQTVAVTLANRTDAPFTGTLAVAAPAMLTATVDKTDVSLAPEEKLTVKVTAEVAQKGVAGEQKVVLSLLRPDGSVENSREITVDYLANRGKIVVKPSYDSYVSKGAPTTDYSGGGALLVDGGSAAMGDESHNIAYLRFPLDMPGKPLSAKLRIRTAASGASESGDSGTIHLVDAEWDNAKLHYPTRPQPGKKIGVLGKVGHDVVEERSLDVDLTGLKELRLVLEPTTCDGASYWSSETQFGPELIVEYDAAQ